MRGLRFRGARPNVATGLVPQLWLDHEDGVYSATGDLPDGAQYTAAAGSLNELKARIRESATAEGWAGWILVD